MVRKFKPMDFLVGFLGVVGGIAVGGLFLDGTTMANPILKILPEMVHTLVGWITIALPIIGIGMKLLSK